MAVSLLTAFVLGELLRMACVNANVYFPRQEAQTTADVSYSSLFASCTDYAATCPPIESCKDPLAAHLCVFLKPDLK